MFSRTLLRYVQLIARAVRLSSVTFLHQERCTFLNFSAIFLHCQIAQGLGTVCIKIFGKTRRSSRGSCKLNTRRYEKLAFFDQNISLYFENDTRCAVIVTTEAEYELVRQQSNGAICNDLQWPLIQISRSRYSPPTKEEQGQQKIMKSRKP